MPGPWVELQLLREVLPVEQVVDACPDSQLFDSLKARIQVHERVGPNESHCPVRFFDPGRPQEFAIANRLNRVL